MSNNQVPTLGINGSTDWVRVNVRNDSTITDWLFQAQDSRIPYVELYRPLPGGSTYEAIQTGDYLPFTTREIPDRFFLFRLTIPRASTETLFVRVQSPFAVDLPLAILNDEALVARVRTDLFDYGLFYGAMLIMAGYNVFVFFSLRENTHVFFFF